MPPEAVDGNGNGIPPAVYAQIAAQINQYTDRPDLFLETIERHDPGFIKSMNEEARAFGKQQRVSRFNFGRVQAYTSLLVQVAAAGVIFYTMLLLAESDKLNFTLLAGLGVLFAVTQSGTAGFLKIVDQISKLWGHGRK